MKDGFRTGDLVASSKLCEIAGSMLPGPIDSDYVSATGSMKAINPQTARLRTNDVGIVVSAFKKDEVFEALVLCGGRLGWFFYGHLKRVQ